MQTILLSFGSWNVFFVKMGFVFVHVCWTVMIIWRRQFNDRRRFHIFWYLHRLYQCTIKLVVWCNIICVGFKHKKPLSNIQRFGHANLRISSTNARYADRTKEPSVWWLLSNVPSLTNFRVSTSIGTKPLATFRKTFSIMSFIDSVACWLICLNILQILSCLALLSE